MDRSMRPPGSPGPDEAVWVVLERARRRSRHGDLRGARAELDRAVALVPEQPGPRLLRAVTSIALDEPQAARDDAARAVQLGGGGAALAVRGWLALHLDDDPRAAERDLTAAIDAGQRDPSTYVTRGWARQALGRHADALDDALHAAAAVPLDPNARFLVGLARIRLGDRRGPADLDRAELLYTASGDLRGRGDVWQARTELRQARTPPAPSEPRQARTEPAHTEPRQATTQAPTEPRQARTGPRQAPPSGPSWWFGPGTGPSPAGAGPRHPLRLPGGYLALAGAVVVLRYLVTVLVIALLTVLLPGLSARAPAVVAVAVTALLYRMLRTGATSLLTRLAAVPLPLVGPVRWPQTGRLPVVAAVRWLASSALAAVLLAVAAWTCSWLGPTYRVDGLLGAVPAGLVLGFGTFVTFPVLRRGV